jgi:GDP-4-dehydro-6-deoxy-D-mannose reductase
MPMKVIITGGNGFVGRHLTKELQQNWADAQIVVWDRQVRDLPEGVVGIEMDITNPETYQKSLQDTQPDFLVHLAAIASIPYALSHPEETKEVNVEGTRRLLQALTTYSPATKVLVVSSSDIYGQGSEVPLSELSLTDCRPANLYSVSKWEMEKMIEQDFTGMTTRVRPFTHIGPGQAQGFVTADFASQVALIEAGKQDPVLRVGNLSAKRDFTDVRDVVRAYRLLMEQGTSGGVYNVASGKAVAIQEILDALLAMAKVKIMVEKDPAKQRPSDVPIFVGSAAALHEATGWKPTIALAQSLKEILDYWRDAVRTS